MQLQTKDQLRSTIGSWAKLGLQKSRTTLGEIVGLHNCAVADKGSIDQYYRELDKAGIRKSRTTLGEIIGLYNCAVADKESIDKAEIKKIARLHSFISKYLKFLERVTQETFKVTKLS